MDRIFKNCGFGSCQYKGSEHHHPFIDEGDAAAFPVGGGFTAEDDKPINYRLVSTPNHPVNRGRNNADFATGHTEAKIIPFKKRGE